MTCSSNFPSPLSVVLASDVCSVTTKSLSKQNFVVHLDPGCQAVSTTAVLQDTLCILGLLSYGIPHLSDCQEVPELAVLLLLSEITLSALEDILELHRMGPRSSTKAVSQHVLIMEAKGFLCGQTEFGGGIIKST